MRLTEHDVGTRMELHFIFESSEHMERLERWGAFEVFPQSVDQMDALLAADPFTTPAVPKRPHNPAKEAR